MPLPELEIIDLRTAPKYIPQLAKWHHDEWTRLNPASTLESRISNMQDYLTDALIPSTFIALNQSALLGSTALVEYDMDTNRHLSPWLASVYVDEPAREQGIGSKLVLHAVDVARNAGFKNLHLFTPDKTDFYTRLGWQILNKEIYRNHDVTVMQFILND